MPLTHSQQLLHDRLAIGAATIAAVAVEMFSSVDRDGDLRVVGRREADEPRLVESAAGGPTSAVPVLPATLDALQRRGRAGALLDDVASSSALSFGGGRRPTSRWLSLLGLDRASTVRPSGSTIRSPMCGFISMPPLATAAATSPSAAA